ncbi:protein YgfX [Vibrio genomosp. F10]|uniref:Uncharacterized protein n=2 Tax=Vibrio genomosp. F10 TaxID=723171 RepID=A0A1B9R1N4_9VIBR|nr:protein YgfX [Vibrio genomosp. F10]OCH78186.1 hypothetical protein A6E14_05790 [Vibrio genomosp. F10]OEE34303.1 hypothetical protein A1QO_08170 [Vibrio genomosp. F10 str. ZF-129]OEE95754.1 hypothetical protein A1QM_04305 [Vibrio genomosp. F10 str. 9ZC157]OEE97881.1 hypothetical protein A1QK_12660 [Vibrio genomosp. F10 str. 9ZD137]OEF03795.1 hypothetical protein A1QI_02620 [Vibrio genomosp. F10 str. 9ZB36]
MPITSQKFVNATAKPSFYALAINTIFLLLMAWLVIISSIPLVLTFILLLSLILVFWHSGFMPRSIRGEFRLSEHGVLEYQQKKYLIRYAVLNVAFVGVVLHFADNQRFLLWRDSVSDDEYRKLLVEIRKAHHE